METNQTEPQVLIDPERIKTETELLAVLNNEQDHFKRKCLLKEKKNNKKSNSSTLVTID